MNTILERCITMIMKWRLSRCKSAKERTSVRRRVARLYRDPKVRDFEAEAKEASLRG
jgi:hypothetical protein